ncbi:MAG: ABC transporter permease subunit [Paracoccaceae bacterium]
MILATLIVPFETIAIPLLPLLASKTAVIGMEGLQWGWLNTYRVQIIPWIADGLTIFLFVQYFKDLPKELIEAARVEGASWWQIYRKVVMPLAGLVLATAAILKFPGGDVQPVPWPLIVVQQEEATARSWSACNTSSSSTSPGRGDGLSHPDHHARARLLPRAATRLHRVDRLHRRERIAHGHRSRKTVDLGQLVCP